ncbi:MAG TPA: MetQ/NlpA family ABC transporter substrate-binding protein [Edaphobacter sp.]|nr:MetQ/NlpA family ABC transporter substrate-binding protein [Edaphobacter sp.]
MTLSNPMLKSRRHRILTATLFVLPLLSGCRHHGRNELRIGVTPGPAEEVLESVRSNLHDQNVDLKIIPFTDYIQPNLALSGHDLDANLYQNIPFMEQFNRDHKTSFVSVAKVYVPLMAIYPGRTHSLSALKDGARVSLPNDPVNQARALHLLQNAGLLVLRPGLGNRTTIADIAENPHHLVLVDLDASQLPRSREDVDLTVINANFALDAGLNPSKDAIFHESIDSIYANVLSVNSNDQADERIAKLGAALRSEATKAFITSHYKGAIYPAV